MKNIGIYDSPVSGKHLTSEEVTYAVSAVVKTGFSIDNQTPFCFPRENNPTSHRPEDSRTTLAFENTNPPNDKCSLIENENQSQTYTLKLPNSDHLHTTGQTPDILKSADVEIDDKEQINSMSEPSLELPSELLDYNIDILGFDQIVPVDKMNESVGAHDECFPLTNMATGQDVNMENDNNYCGHSKSFCTDEPGPGVKVQHHQFQLASSAPPHTCNETGCMNIDVIARSKIISSHHFEDSKGCMLLNSASSLQNLSDADAEKCFGQDYNNRHKITLDTWKASLSQLLPLDQTTFARRAETIENNLCRPLVIFVENGDIKVERHCTATVQTVSKLTDAVPEYVTRFDQARHPKTIFRVSNYFQPALKLYENTDVLAPEPSTGVYLIIGQRSSKFRDDFEKILLMLHVTNCKAHRELQRVKEEKSKSLSLTNSLPNEVDKLLEKTTEMSI